MGRAVRFKRVIPRSGGQYDTDTATTHETEDNYTTLCGATINTAKKWQLVGTHWGVTCTRCLKKIEERRYAR